MAFNYIHINKYLYVKSFCYDFHSNKIIVSSNRKVLLNISRYYKPHYEIKAIIYFSIKDNFFSIIMLLGAKLQWL